MSVELGLPNYDNMMFNSRFSFRKQLQSSCNTLIKFHTTELMTVLQFLCYCSLLYVPRKLYFLSCMKDRCCLNIWSHICYVLLIPEYSIYDKRHRASSKANKDFHTNDKRLCSHQDGKILRPSPQLVK